MTPREAELTELIFRLCDRIYAAHEVIGKNAERKETIARPAGKEVA